jgi:hypothetical protein
VDDFELETFAVGADDKFAVSPFNLHKLFGLKPRFAVRAFDHFLFAADRNRRDEKKKRDEIHSRFFRKLCNRSALTATNHIVRLLRTPSNKFCADD